MLRWLLAVGHAGVGGLTICRDESVKHGKELGRAYPACRTVAEDMLEQAEDHLHHIRMVAGPVLRTAGPTVPLMFQVVPRNLVWL